MNYKLSCFALLLLIVFSYPSIAQWTIDVESGLAFENYNKVRIPNEQGTLFNFTDDFELEGPVIPFRARVGFTFYDKNHLILLYAPLSLNYTGKAPYDINFQESTFGEGQNIDGFYKFNSYRLTYRRDFIRNENWIVGLGFTAKIRDASVSLENDAGLSDRKDDLGFVPLLHAFAEYQFSDYSIYFEGDGLAGGPGRAFDLFLGGRILLTEEISAKAGYRLLEGGANIDEVYNFTWIDYAVVGLILQF
ncbi:hypothetical protein JKA74_09180 [Marivirga sp. S37H4]|uniref:Outer membrane protein beta-barrel domain-containing protein n=1 Tax=Marivirga aurantiaca TaxID=2802615 RepID=A0A935C7Z0_9BACT|nr:hypothetical protein [Marivirga aurantiaca]MBK6265210.1 hypothetical protein [Marivirga aurantiaca]